MAGHAPIILYCIVSSRCFAERTLCVMLVGVMFSLCGEVSCRDSPQITRRPQEACNRYSHLPLLCRREGVRLSLGVALVLDLRPVRRLVHRVPEVPGAFPAVACTSLHPITHPCAPPPHPHIATCFAVPIRSASTCFPFCIFVLLRSLGTFRGLHPGGAICVYLYFS